MVYLLDDYDITRHTTRILLKPLLCLLNEPHPMEDKSLVIRLCHMMKRLLNETPQSIGGVVHCHVLLCLDQLLTGYDADTDLLDVVLDLITRCCSQESDYDMAASGLMERVKKGLRELIKTHNVSMVVKGLQTCEKIMSQCELTRMTMMTEELLKLIIAIMREFFSQTEIIISSMHFLNRMIDNPFTHHLIIHNSSLPSLLQSLQSCYSSFPFVFESSQQLSSLLLSQSDNQANPAGISSNLQNERIQVLIQAMNEASEESAVALSKELCSASEQIDSLNQLILLLHSCQSLVCSFASNPCIVMNLLTVIGRIFDDSIAKIDCTDSAFESFVRSELRKSDCPYALPLVHIVRSACARNVICLVDCTEVQDIIERYIGSSEEMNQELSGILYEVCRNSPNYCHSIIYRYGDF